MSSDLDSQPVVLFVGVYKLKDFQYWRSLLAEEKITARWVPTLATLGDTLLAYCDRPLINVVVEISDYEVVLGMSDSMKTFVTNRFDFNLLEAKRGAMIQA